LNLTSALLKQIIIQQDFESWGNLRENYLTAEYQSLYRVMDTHIKNFNHLPSFDDLKLSIRDRKLQEKVFAIEAVEVDIDAWVLLEYLKNEYTQVEILDELDKFIDKTVAISSAEENVEAIQQIVLDVGERVDLKAPEENMQTIPLFDSEKDLKKFLPLGLNDDYDQTLKFSPRDLILVGGRRGAGKSIACCNVAHNVYEQGKSSLYFTIEMDSRSILQRMCALGARIPISRLATRNLTTTEWDRVADWWAGRFEGGSELLPEYNNTRDFDAFHTKLQTKPLHKDRQLDVVYDPTLTLSRIRQELESKVSQTNYGVIIVDYLNQVKRSNVPSRSGQYDWTEQIEVSKTLKSIAQEYEIPVFAPYQTDSTGEARFAKGILDAADAAFTLETWSPEDEAITFNCTKMRSAKMEGFTSVMDWETLKIGPHSTMNPKEKEDIKDSLSTGEDIYDAI
jgi:replicative DNA helicase|tara:strand:+ start:283 stop:1638 length:1356 start_codon:yes stop_codon:yes gene_type:complete